MWFHSTDKPIRLRRDSKRRWTNRNWRFARVDSQRQPGRIPTFQNSRDARRRGFTLFEMMLIMAVLISAFAVSWPSLNRMYQDAQLKQGVDQVQVQLVSARVHSVDAGMMYQFRYEPGGRRFMIIPFDQEGMLSSDLTLGTGGGGQVQTVWKCAGIIGETLQFDATGLGTTASQVPIDWLNGLPNSGDFVNTNWSAPMYFNADGSSTGGTLDVYDSHGQFARIFVRPLTGGVTVSKIESRGR